MKALLKEQDTIINCESKIRILIKMKGVSGHKIHRKLNINETKSFLDYVVS